MAAGANVRPCTVVLHDDTEAKENVMCGANVLAIGSIGYLTAPGSKSLCILSQTPASNPDEVSISASLARVFGFENRIKGTVDVLQNREVATATHVELSFRDVHLSRADMWRMKDQLDATVIYGGQMIKYLGTDTAVVEAIYIEGHSVRSAFVSHPRTRLIFRSGSARYTILIQISKEMLEYWHFGDLMYERLIGGFLPDLFRRWEDLKVRHQVTVVLFGRRVPSVNDQELSKDETEDMQPYGSPPNDFFNTVAADMPSSEWRKLLQLLKKTFNGMALSRQVSLAAKGNMLEAIHIAGLDFNNYNIDPRLATSGTSIIAITAGAGLFEADHGLLRSTTQLLMGNSVGVDIVSVCPKPLHPVPLFQYRRSDVWEYALPHWADISYWRSSYESHASKWLFPDQWGDVSDIAIPTMRSKIVVPQERSLSDTLNGFDDDAFCDVSSGVYGRPASSLMLPGDTPETLTSWKEDELAFQLDGPARLPPKAPTRTSSQQVGFSPMLNVTPRNDIKKDAVPRHALMQMGRKISLGPKGLAPSQGVAITTITTQHAQLGGENAMSTILPNSNTSSELTKQLRESLRGKAADTSLPLWPPPESPQISKPLDTSGTEERKVSDSSDPASIVEKAVMRPSSQPGRDSDRSLSATPKVLRGGLTMPKASSIFDEDHSMTPWLTLLNPCNPRRDNMRVASEYRQWQNVFPRALSSSEFKWDSMCTPAVLPLMTEHRISLTELERHLDKKVRRLVTAVNVDAHAVMRQMIVLRLTAGFQIVPVRRLPHTQMPSEQIDRMLLSLGSCYHELRCLSDVEVQVSQFERAVATGDVYGAGSTAKPDYAAQFMSPVMRRERSTVVDLRAGDAPVDWSALDDEIMNADVSEETLGTSRMRLVLIPVEIPHAAAQDHARNRELTDEERHIDGIQRLTQTWQRNRVFANEDLQHQSSMAKPNSSGTADRDPNPLAIEYQTRDPSAVVSAYGVVLDSQLINGEAAPPLFAESERYHSSNFDLVKLVKQLQEPPPSGVDVKDRRWFTRLHLKCFRGDEMTNWLLRVFKDLRTRVDAVALGNQLMDSDVFTHVRGKHEFLDGNYFYQIKAAYRTTDYPDTAGLFAKGIGRSVPSTPIIEFKQSPTVRAAQNDSETSSKGIPTPILAPVDCRETQVLLLSQVLQYNVDPAKKSSQTEIIDVHYDRIHNPQNCYHIQLDWTNTTPKLIRDSTTRWSSLLESFGLRQVQVPLVEASKYPEQHPFDHAVTIRLAVRPPDRMLTTPHLDPYTSSPRSANDPNIHHKTLLRKLDFVLDFEAASSFPRKVEVRYSWGKPDYDLTQFVHRSGLLLAQISNDGKSDFLLLRNPLASVSSVAAKKIQSSTLEGIVKSVRAFCGNTSALRALYEEVNKPKVSPMSPLAHSGFGADVDVPPMELPPYLLHRSHKHDVSA